MPPRSALEELDEPRAVAAVAMLDAAAAAVPVLPDDPLEVLDLERDQGDTPEQDLSVVHLPKVVGEGGIRAMGHPACLVGRRS